MTEPGRPAGGMTGRTRRAAILVACVGLLWAWPSTVTALAAPGPAAAEFTAVKKKDDKEARHPQKGHPPTGKRPKGHPPTDQPREGHPPPSDPTPSNPPRSDLGVSSPTTSDPTTSEPGASGPTAPRHPRPPSPADTGTGAPAPSPVTPAARATAARATTAQVPPPPGTPNQAQPGSATGAAAGVSGTLASTTGQLTNTTGRLDRTRSAGSAPPGAAAVRMRLAAGNEAEPVGTPAASAVRLTGWRADCDGTLVQVANDGDDPSWFHVVANGAQEQFLVRGWSTRSVTVGSGSDAAAPVRVGLAGRAEQVVSSGTRPPSCRPAGLAGLADGELHGPDGFAGAAVTAGLALLGASGLLAVLAARQRLLWSRCRKATFTQPDGMNVAFLQLRLGRRTPGTAQVAGPPREELTGPPDDGIEHTLAWVRAQERRGRPG